MFSKSEIQLKQEYACDKANVREVIATEFKEQLSSLYEQAEELLDSYLQGDYYESKNQRIKELKQMDMSKVIQDLIIEVLLLQGKGVITEVIGRLANRLDFEETQDSIKTLAELLAVIKPLGLYELDRTENGIITVISNIRLPDHIKKYLSETQFLLPMIIKPLKLENTANGYISNKDSLILGKGNKEPRNVCKDSLETFNSVELTLDKEFICQVNMPEKEFNNEQDYKNYRQQVIERYSAYKYLISKGNSFYLTHRTDKRGRTYAYGYHVNTQGDTFSKAILDLANKEKVDIPDENKKRFRRYKSKNSHN